VHDLGLPGDLAERFIAAAERAFATGGVQSLDYDVPQAGGETIHLEARVVPSGDTEYFVLVRDVSDRKRAQLALEENERRSRALLAGIPDNIFRVRRADNRFIDMGAASLIWSRPVASPTGAAEARHILMPLYWAGLCDAVNIAPGASSLPDAK